MVQQLLIISLNNHFKNYSILSTFEGNNKPMKISFLKRTKPNDRFNYTPRYYKGKEDDNPYDFATKFDKYREIYNKNDFGNQWRDARFSARKRSNRGNAQHDR